MEFTFLNNFITLAIQIRVLSKKTVTSSTGGGCKVIDLNRVQEPGTTQLRLFFCASQIGPI